MNQPASYNENAAETRARRLWLDLLYAAVVAHLSTAVALGIYVAWTWNQPNRGWIVAVAVAALAIKYAIYSSRRLLIASRYRVWIFCGWNTATFGIVALLCMLDGGINSPITYFYILPVLFLGIGYPPLAVLLSGFIGLTGYILLIGLQTGTVYAPTNLLQIMAFSIGWALAVLGAVNRCRESTAMRALNQRLENLAAIDELTGCLNQRAFSTAMRQEIARAARYEHELALLLIDVDYFKQVNDQHGHLMGDEVLREVGKILRYNARDADMVGRPGGDELALLAPETGREAANVLAERVRSHMKIPPLPCHITLSIGICVAGPEIEDVATLFWRADQALYTAKSNGRNQVSSYQDTSAKRPPKRVKSATKKAGSCDKISYSPR